MKPYRKTISVLIVLSMLFTIAAMPFQTFAASLPEDKAERVEASISVTLRIDYAQKLSVLKERNLQAQLLYEGESLGKVTLTDTNTMSVGSYPAQVGLRNADGGDLAGGEWPAFADLTVKGLNEGTYTLRLTGKGYRDFSQKIELKDYSVHLIVGTGDDTFTLGDINSDGSVNMRDRGIIAENLGKTDEQSLRMYDLSGDGKTDIVDLAYVARSASIAARGTMGQAEIMPTYITNPADLDSVNSALAESGTIVKSGVLSDLFKDNDSVVSVSSESDTVEIPITFKKNEMVEEVIITSPEGETAAQCGTVSVVYEDEITEEISFDNTAPNGTYAIGREEEKSVVTVNLGRRVAVKKITISVAKTQSGYVVMESIRFLREIVPETPVAANNTVKNLTAAPGSEKVTLKWDRLPNVTGYKIEYYQSKQPEKQRELHVSTNKADISGLENLKEYTFTVTPVADAWVGKPAYITAVAEPSSRPEAPDMVNIKEGDGCLGVSWKSSKNAVYYKVFYAANKESAAELDYIQFGGSMLGTSMTISNLENGKAYSIYVVAGNSIGESKPSRIYSGTPFAVDYSRPAGIPTKGILDYTEIDKVWLEAAYNVSPSSYASNKPFKNENMADGDFSTHWTSHSYGDGNWWNSKKVFCTFKEPADISSVIWVPRLDGGYANNLRVYTVSVWLDGDDLNKPGRQIAPSPERGSTSNVNTWLPVKGNQSSEKFAVLPIEPQKNVVKMSITIEQVGYTAVSLSELMFMQYDPQHSLPDNIGGLFADTLHTLLADGVTQADIDGLRTRLNSDERNYYLDVNILADELDLAQELLSGHSNGVIIDGVSSRSNAADAAKYQQSGSELQPLGVAAKSGSEITVYADGIPAGESVSLYASQYNAEASAWLSSMGSLQNGRNVLKVPKIGSQTTDRGGSLYFSYSCSSPDGIKLHIRLATDIPVLELSDWYLINEEQRRQAINTYIDELIAYPSKVGINNANRTTNCLNVTEISMPSVLLSIPAQSVLTGIGYPAASRADMEDTLYKNTEAWEDLIHICKTTQGIDKTYENSDMTSRQNIRCMQMFAGAFMYAAGSHVGIGYSSCAGMVCGKPISALAQNASANRLFGWGIAHEIGHNMDKLGQAEITNNIYSLMVQTYDGKQNIFTSRLEASGKYASIFNKVAQGYPGASNDVFVQLGMYWQLHLAYDNGSEPMKFYNDLFKAWKAGTYTNGALSYDERVALTASGVTGKDLSEFFTRWGMRLSGSVLQKIKTYDKETRAIWYLNDNSRRAALRGEAAASGELRASASLEKGKDNSVRITIDSSGIKGEVQGYEILRGGIPVAFTTENTYTDIIGTANHRTYEYEVKAYDILGNCIGEPAQAGQIRVAYDVTVDSSEYSVVRNGDTLTFKLAKETSVSGIKISASNHSLSGSFTVEITDKEGKTVTAKQGDFSQNQAVDDKNSFLSYFNKPGAEQNDTRIWTFDAKTVKVTGVPANIKSSEVRLISYAGDDISFLDGMFAGRLAKDYVYGSGNGDVIAADTLVIVGNYRGDPVWNGIKIKGRYISTKIGEDGEPVITLEDRYIDGYTLMFAEIPEDGAVSDISDGIFIFVPNVQKEAELQNITHCDGENLLPSQIKAEIFRTDDPNNTENLRTTAETLWVFSPGGNELPVIEMEARS